MPCRIRGSAAVLLLVLVAARPALAGKPLPGFQVLTLQGEARSSAQLAPHEQWLLLYVHPDCPSCPRLLETLEGWRLGEARGRVVLVVGAEPSIADAYVRKAMPATPAEAERRTWYADPGGEAAKALHAEKVPILLGVRRGQIEWEISGVLNGPAALERVVRAWLGVLQ
ncbi:MAG: hypothetical protein DMF77_12695 [Acidobacteria bacterium]|nr:MAG: hypothetical protein DMF77_12695 [Acidobacteriota bacterium]